MREVKKFLMRELKEMKSLKRRRLSQNGREMRKKMEMKEGFHQGVETHVWNSFLIAWLLLGLP